MTEVHTNRQEESIMKTTFRFIIAAMAAIAVFSSCQKELVNESANKTTDGVRTISVLFDNSTKATLDGFTPKFEENDAIRVSNTEKSEERTISVDGSGKATFTTTLSGELTAIYPADAAVLSSDTDDAPIASSNNFKVSTSQTGKLTDAIIAKATIAENSSVATFHGQTAVFRITPGAGPSTRYVEVITAGPEIANNVPTGSAFTKYNKIHVETDDGDEVFVSVLVPDGGLKLRDLSFADGSNMKTVIDAKPIAANTIYTIKGDSGWDKAYVEIEMTVNGDTKKYKWATMNIGATSEADYGYYFFWGGTVGYKRNGSKWVKADVTPEEELTNGFAQANVPHYSGSAYTKYTGTSGDGKTVLELADDAANANWGGSWRMPTEAEVTALKLLKRGTFGSGYYFGTSDNAQIFLPAAGYGSGTDLYNAGDRGHYRSSSLYTADPSSAYYLFFNSSSASTRSDYRYHGRSVRALSE